MGRVAAVNLDAAEWAFIEELVTAGELPFIAAMLDRGTFVPLETPVAYRSEYSATEFLTGQSAATTRYWSTVTFDPASYHVTTVGSALRTPFYARDPQGLVVTLDVPHAVLVPDLAGAQVVGWGGHDARFQFARASSPPNLMAEIDARFGVDPATAVEYTGSWHQEWYVEALADALVQSARRRTDVALWLLDRYPEWSLFLMGVPDPHSAGHNFCQGVDPSHLLASHPTSRRARERFVEVYRAVDAGLGRLSASLPADASLVVFSVKGMQPNRDDVASGVLLPELLYRLAFRTPLIDQPGARRWRRRGYPPIHPDPAGSVGPQVARLAVDGRLAGLKRRYRAKAPDSVRGAVRELRRRLAGRPPSPRTEPAWDDGDEGFAAADAAGPGPVSGDVDWHPAMRYRRWWDQMRWFALPSFSDGHVRLNVDGRERCGVVSVDRYEQECDALEAELRRCTDPRTGEPVVDDVMRLRSDDPLAPDGPGADLVVTWRAPTDALEHPSAGLVGPFPFPRSGSHTPDGFLLAAGNAVPRGRVDRRPALDLPPTLLAMLGWPVPDELEGRAVEGVTRPPVTT